MIKATGISWTHVFDYKSKTTRKEYLLAWVGNILIYLIGGMFLLPMVTAWIEYPFHITENARMVGAYVEAIVIVTAFALIQISLNVRRLRDVGMSPWLGLLMILFPISWIFFVAIAFIPSKSSKK
ncbi:DUF805 domain-containing protein [Periweissella cryptocerci]|uniref:DUF805 domain-containing protein n=1 Tax=Periweissella cryptocerci TaxID=2506420 RepID=A0A4P6YSY6_9LACO|nr:DUF805 domain-containing protein [Periweissella cryptocerci]QBO35747.1 DUF805 domain-containing protein [Periweissella cryptocerci]